MSRFTAAICVTVPAVALGAALAVGPPVIPMAALAAAGLVGLTLWRPNLAVLVYAGSRPLIEPIVFLRLGPLTMGQWWGAGLVAVMAAYWLLRLSARWQSGRMPSLVPLTFCVVYALLTLWRPDVNFALVNIVKLLSWLGLIATVEDVASNRDGRRQVGRAGIASAVLILAVMAFSIMTGRYGEAYYAGQLADGGQGPHGIASLAVMTLPFVLLLSARGRSSIAMVLTGLIGVGVVLSLVRTTLVAFVLITGVFAFATFWKRGTRALMPAVGIIGAVAAGVYFLQGEFIGRLSDLQFLSKGGGSEIWAGGGRIGIWLAVLHSVFDSVPHLFFGHGAGTTFEVVYTAMGASVWAHNDFLEFLMTGGVVMLLAYVGVLVWCARSVAMLPSQTEIPGIKPLAAAAVAAFVFMAFFNGMAFYQASIVFALLIGLVRGLALDTPVIAIERVEP